MKISSQRTADTLIALAEDRLDGSNARAFQLSLRDAIAEHDRLVILDMSRLTYISSAGLRVILLTARSLQRQDAKLAVCSLSGPVREVFTISGFDRIIPTYDTRSDATSALSG